MKYISPTFRRKSQQGSLEPVSVLKIINDHKTIYFTSRQVSITDPSASIFQESIVSLGGSSLSVVPERGIATVGDVTATVQDNGLTELLREIKNTHQDTLNNNKAEIYSGYTGMSFSDFVKTTLWVSGIDNNETEFTIMLSDTVRIVKKSIFEPKAKTEVITSLLLREPSVSLPIVMNVESTAGFEMVQHTPDWEFENTTSNYGYLKVTGVTARGEDAKEILCYNNKTATSFSIIKRGCFGTRIVNMIALEGDDRGENSNELEVEECIYLDLPVPKMAVALLTGDLAGQVGQKIPQHWNVGISDDLIDISSFLDIGSDLNNQRLQFIDMDKEESKEFINSQVLSPFGVFMSINQDGELLLRRYDFMSQFGAGDKSLGYDQILNSPTISRNFKTIRNRFLINWEWRVDQDYYARQDAYLDVQSSETFNITSDTMKIDLRGVKNTSTSSKTAIDFVAQSIATRFSNPSITFQINCHLGDVIELDVGDTVTLNLPNHPDYDSLDTLISTFEIQGATYDYLRGTASLNLYSSAGKPSQFNGVSGSDAVSISHAGWTQLTSTHGVISGGNTITIHNGYSFPAGKYWFNGNIIFNSTCYINSDVQFDANGGFIDVKSTAIINGKGRGVVGAVGYLGGEDSGQDGIRRWAAGSKRKWRSEPRAADRIITASKSTVDVPFINRLPSNSVLSIPSPLYGSGGGRGMFTFNQGDTAEGGSFSAGGAGLALIADEIFISAAAAIDTSGADSNVGGVIKYAGSSALHAGSSGFGYPGAIICYVKKRSAPLPILNNAIKARAGKFIESAAQGEGGEVLRPYNGERTASTSGDYRPFYPPAAANSERDYAQVAFRAVRLLSPSIHSPEAGVDNVSNAIAPILSLKENMNTPRTPNGNISTITVNANAAPSDTGYSYTLFEYRNKALNQWIPITYKTSGEATVEVVSDGTTYQFRGTSYNKQNISGGVSIAEITVANVSRGTGASDGGNPNAPDAIKVPPIKRLELVNRITEDDWDKFKSPNAEFRWAKLSNTLGGSIIQLNGTTDLHLQGYNIRIKDVSGKILREEQVRDSFYTYTYDENKKDTGGNPVRKFKFEVQAVATTGHVSNWNGFEVENPAPAAPSGIVIDSGFTTISLRFDLPDDVDFIGVDVFLIEGTGDPYAQAPQRISGNSFGEDGLVPGTPYTIGLRSVDQFGLGGQTTPVGFSTRLIESSALGEITTPVVIDEQGGRLITNNSGYIAFHGAVSAPSESPSPLIFGTVDGSTYPFWVDASGNGKFGRLMLGAGGSITSPNFSIAANGAATFSGALSAATGTFSGNLSAAGGTFAGTLSAADGVITNITATNINISGTSSFSGAVVAQSFATASSGQRIELNVASQRLDFFDSANKNYQWVGPGSVNWQGAFGVDNNTPDSTMNYDYGFYCNLLYNNKASLHGARYVVTNLGSSAGLAFGVECLVESGINGVSYGGKFVAEKANTNYGVYAEARFGATNWAGYFVGNVYVSGTFSNPSDERLKKEIKPLKSSLSKLLNIGGYSFLKDEKLQFGVIAQELQKVIPEIVEEGEEGYLSVRYLELIPLLIEAVKELSAEVDKLRSLQ
jgi:hypothetical protein